MIAIRKIVRFVEEFHSEQGTPLARPLHRVVVGVVIANPLAGRFVPDLESLYPWGKDLGVRLTTLALDQLRVTGGDGSVKAYGKGALVGLAGELEHAAAILHPRFGAAVRETLKDAQAIMPSTAKRAGPGATLDIPLHSVHDMWSFDHFDTVSIAVQDGPQPDELLIALAVADGGRPLARITRPSG